MAYKERTQAKMHRIYQVLDCRMGLSAEGKQELWAMDRGLEGEFGWDGHTEKLRGGSLILNDVHLRNRYAKFQMDTVLVTGGPLYLIEVKNFEGEYQWGETKLIKWNGTKIANPLLKLEENKVKLELFLERSGFPKEVAARIVYINPSFHMPVPEGQKQHLLYPQIRRFLQEVERNDCPLTEKDRRLAQLLKEQHYGDYVDDSLPAYTYAQLKKGITCPKCSSLRTLLEGKMLCCSFCWGKSVARLAIKGSVDQFKLLFPTERVTTRRMQEWCACEDRFRIYRTLQEYWTPVGAGPHRFYV